MDIDRLIAERSQGWTRLDELLEQVEEGHGIGRPKLAELLALYRLTADDLNRARSLTANPEILGQLNRLAVNAYRVVHGERRRTWRWSSIPAFYLKAIPEALRRCRSVVLTATLLLCLGFCFGLTCVTRDPGLAAEIIPGMFYTESPAERIHTIEEGSERVDKLVKAASFAAELYTHNIRVALLAFGLGALTLIGGWWLLFVNGSIVGAITAQYIDDGAGTFLIAWIGPHGALELPAIVVAAAAGLHFGSSLLLPGEVGRGTAIRRALPDTWRLLGCSCTMLVFAGMIEGSFSQFSAKTVAYPIKIAVAVGLFAIIATYLSGFLAVRRMPEER